MSDSDISMQRGRLKSALKVCGIAVAAYVILNLLFYLLTGDQLRYRESAANTEMPPVSSGTTELCQGAVIDQHFTTGIEYLDEVDILFGTYYRQNAGIVAAELIDFDSGNILMRGEYDAAQIVEGESVVLSAGSPVELTYDQHLVLRVYSSSLPGSSVSPFMSDTTADGDMALFINGQAVEGTLCFSLEGEDSIWLGQHFWAVAAAGLAVLLVFLGVETLLFIKGRHSYVVNAFAALKKYRFLISQLVSRDFKTKYKRSVLGVLWSFLNPLLMMFIQYLIFSTVFKSEINFYPAYLLIGVVCFNFFSEVCNMSLTSILGNASLITKVYIPKYIYPLTRTVSSLINFGISLIPVILVCILTGVPFRASALLSFYFILCMCIFCFGLGLMLSAAMVFFRDTQFLWGVVSLAWMYATPIFYPESILGKDFAFILVINPMYYFIKSIRACLITGISPEPLVYIECAGIALVTLLLGGLIFRKSQNKFVLYL